MPQPKNENRPPDAQGYGQGYAYFGMALSFTVAILLFGGLGWLVDGWLHTRPLVAIAGAFLGGFAGFMSIYYRVKKETAEDKKTTAEDGGRRRRGQP